MGGPNPTQPKGTDSQGECHQHQAHLDPAPACLTHPTSVCDDSSFESVPNKGRAGLQHRRRAVASSHRQESTQGRPATTVLLALTNNNLQLPSQLPSDGRGPTSPRQAHYCAHPAAAAIPAHAPLPPPPPSQPHTPTTLTAVAPLTHTWPYSTAPGPPKLPAPCPAARTRSRRSRRWQLPPPHPTPALLTPWSK